MPHIVYIKLIQQFRQIKIARTFIRMNVGKCGLAALIRIASSPFIWHRYQLIFALFWLRAIWKGIPQIKIFQFFYKIPLKLLSIIFIIFQYFSRIYFTIFLKLLRNSLIILRIFWVIYSLKISIIFIMYAHNVERTIGINCNWALLKFITLPDLSRKYMLNNQKKKLYEIEITWLYPSPPIWTHVRFWTLSGSHSDTN